MHSINKLFDKQKKYVDYIGDELIANLTPLDQQELYMTKSIRHIDRVFEDITDKNYDASISYSGGVVQNVIWNTALKNKFPNLVIPPHCNDEGLSLGALEYLRVKNNLPPFSINNFPFCQSDESPNSIPSEKDNRENRSVITTSKSRGWYQGHGRDMPKSSWT